MELTMRSRRSHLHRIALAALVAGFLPLASVAHAGPAAADRETARTLMEQGRELRAAGNEAEALKRFQAANEVMHVPTTALEVARSQAALKLLVEARDTIGVLRQMPAEHESKVFKAARESAEQLDSTLAGRVPTLTIAVKGVAEGQDVTVAIDDVPVPATVVGLPRTVDPGHHVITARTKKGEAKQECDVAEGERKALELTLMATAAETEPPPAEAPAPVPAEPPPTEISHSPNTLAWIGIGVGGAGLIVGTVTGILTLSKGSTLSGQCGNNVCGPSSYGTIDSANTTATISDIAFGFGIAGAGLAAYALIKGHPVTASPSSPAPVATPDTQAPGSATPPAPPADSALHVTPWFAGTSAGLAGTF
jgi:hypothetical protein